jgi:hypothetical protein
MSGLVKLAVVAAVIGLIAINLPDIKRYLRLRSM